jgi:hypothetical protein
VAPVSARPLALAALAALAAAPAASAELVAPGVHDGALALGPGGIPRVAYVSGRELWLATRAAPAAWRRARVALLPSDTGSVAGLEISRSGRPAILAEDRGGRWLALAEPAGRGWRLTPLVRRPAAGAALGPAGLAFDARGAPVVAYALRRPDDRTFLRLVRRAGARYRTFGVTRQGFPPSRIPPAAAPVVLPGGAVRVVEAYGAGPAAAIDWMPHGADWLGQFLYSSPLGALAGPVAAVARGAVVYAAWTTAFPSLGGLGVVLAAHTRPVRSAVVLEGARLAALALGPTGPELGAVVEVDAGSGALAAGLLRSPDGSLVELDGALLGLAVSRSGARQALTDAGEGLSWFAETAGAARGVELAASSAPGGVALSGHVLGATAGAVTIYRESPGAPRVAVASAPVGADGSFVAADAPGPGPRFYRAVYDAGGLPLAALLRAPVSSG